MLRSPLPIKLKIINPRMTQNQNHRFREIILSCENSDFDLNSTNRTMKKINRVPETFFQQIELLKRRPRRFEHLYFFNWSKRYAHHYRLYNTGAITTFSNIPC